MYKVCILVTVSFLYSKSVCTRSKRDMFAAFNVYLLYSFSILGNAFRSSWLLIFSLRLILINRVKSIISLKKKSNYF